MERPLLISTRVAVALVLLTPLIVNARFLPDTYFPFIVGKAVYAHALTEIAFGLWLVLALAYPRHRPPTSPLLLIFAAYVVVVLISSFMGVSPQRSLWSTYERMQGFVDLAHWFAFIAVMTSVFRSWRDWRVLLNINLTISVVMALLGLAEQYKIWEFNPLDPGRITITLGNPTYVGAYMMVNVLIGLGLLARSFGQRDAPRVRSFGQRDAPQVRRKSRRRIGGGQRSRQGVSWLGWWGIGWTTVMLVLVFLLFLTSQPLLFFWLVFALGLFGASYLLSEGHRLEAAYARLRVGHITLELVKRSVADILRPATSRWVSDQFVVDWWRVFWTIAIVLNAEVLYLSATRGALLGLGVGLMAFGAGYALWGRAQRLRAVSLALVAGVLFLAMLLFAVRNTSAFQSLARSQTMLTRIADTGAGDASLKGRFNSWTNGLRGFAARPVLGWGPENFTIANDRYLTAESIAQSITSFDQAHNKLIEELTTKGGLGFAGYMAIWLYMAWVLVREARRKESSADQALTLFAGAALTGYFVQNLFLFDTPGTVTQFILLLGFVVYLDSDSTAGLDAARQPSGSDKETRSLLKSDVSRAIALGVVGVLTLLALISFNLGPIVGARSISLALNPNLSWDERFDLFEKSFSSFPPLANYPRVEMFTKVAAAWGNLSQDEKQRAIRVAVTQGQLGVESEPEDWRIHLTLARLYQLASPHNPAFLADARSLVERASVLAPERIETVQMQVMQYVTEGKLDVARETIDSYVERNPSGAVYFEGLRRQIGQVAGQ